MRLSGKLGRLLTISRISFTLMLAVLSGFVHAQVTYDGCRDFRGQLVASISDYSLDDVAIARIEGQRAVIRYNPNILATQMSEPTRRFFYIHECAHHFLGHTTHYPSLQSERSADCWAIQVMSKELGFSRNSLKVIQRDIRVGAKANWTHLPGPERAIDIEQCLNASIPKFRKVAKGFCGDLRTVLGGIGGNYESLRRRRGKSPANIRISGMDECSVHDMFGPETPSYTCSTKKHPDVDSAIQHHNSLGTAIESCLGSDWRVKKKGNEKRGYWEFKRGKYEVRTTYQALSSQPYSKVNFSVEKN